MQSIASLDIGCGSGLRYPADPRGDVNCDIDRPHSKIPNFVRCEARNLPFKDRAFKKCYANHLIEHCEDPNVVMKECFRVAKDVVVIKTPHILSVNSWKDKNHKHHFTKRWFEKYGNCRVEILPYDLSKFPRYMKKIAYKFHFMIKILPDELLVTIKR